MGLLSDGSSSGQIPILEEKGISASASGTTLPSKTLQKTRSVSSQKSLDSPGGGRIMTKTETHKGTSALLKAVGDEDEQEDGRHRTHGLWSDMLLGLDHRGKRSHG